MTLKVQTKEGPEASIGFHCCVCSRHQSRKESEAGQKVKCTQCHSWIRVPRKQPQSYRQPPGEKATVFRSLFDGCFGGFLTVIVTLGITAWLILKAQFPDKPNGGSEKPAVVAPKK